jgi:hypothetical protein
MGSLHEGHLALVDRARDLASFVVMSIFVNPTQFGPARTSSATPGPGGDAELAEQRGVELLFAPTTGEMYPAGEPVVRVVPGRLADRLCGLNRPGHFEGVLTVVAKLFGASQPDVAVFGQKDYQQAALIRRMVADLDMPVRIEVAPIVRDADGLALSSRNAYLSADGAGEGGQPVPGPVRGGAAFDDGRAGRGPPEIAWCGVGWRERVWSRSTWSWSTRTTLEPVGEARVGRGAGGGGTSGGDPAHRQRDPGTEGLGGAPCGGPCARARSTGPR